MLDMKNHNLTDYATIGTILNYIKGSCRHANNAIR